MNSNAVMLSSAVAISTSAFISDVFGNSSSGKHPLQKEINKKKSRAKNKQAKKSRQQQRK